MERLGNRLISGKARFTVMTGRLLRLEWSAEGTFTDSPSLVFINRDLPPVPYQTGTDGGWLVLSTESLELRYKEGGGRFSPANLSIRLLGFEPETVWTPGLKDGGNLKGTTRTLDETEGEGSVELEPGLLSRSGWALVDDSRTPLFDDTDPPWVVPRPDDGNQDWYFFGYGHSYLEALKDFTRVAGRIPLPPKYALGYWWSRYWAYSDAELRDLVNSFEQRGLPLDLLVIDMDWHRTDGLSRRHPKRDASGEVVGWTGYSWNRELFPDPAAFLDWAHGKGLKVALNLHPASGIVPGEDGYDAFRRDYSPASSPDTEFAYALEDRVWAKAYFEHIIRPLEKDGVDLWWLDWQAWRDSKMIKGLNNTWWLNHVFFTDMQRQGKKRPLLFHRWGGLGNHRYQVGFSGDTWISWNSLAFLPYFTATAGNVCYGWWSHDIGGHMGGPGSAELYLRWLQYGVFSPILRTHATKDSQLERRTWMFPELQEQMREALLLRRSLVPYLYAQGRKAYEEGVSLCRPLYWLHPEEEAAYRATNQYYFGDDIITAPITKPVGENGLCRQCVWLPEGRWFDPAHGAILDGGIEHSLDYALAEIPLFIRCGAVIPRLEQGQSLHEPFSNLILDLYPGAGGTGELYDDEGDNDNYQTGACTRIRFSQRQKGTSLRLELHPREGAFAGMPDRISFRLRFHHRLPPQKVILDGTELPFSHEGESGSWSYDGKNLCVEVNAGALDPDQAHLCELKFTKASLAAEGLLEQVPGILKRLPDVMILLKNELNRLDPIANLSSTTLRYGSFATRLSYRPDTVHEELSAFHQAFPALLASLLEWEGADQALLKTVVKRLSYRQFLAPEPTLVFHKGKNASTLVSISTEDTDMELHYTLDGSLPDLGSPLYRKPFRLNHTTLVRARAFRSGLLPGFPAEQVFHRPWVEWISYRYPCSPAYSGEGRLPLADGSFGNSFDYKKHWVGFEGRDAVITVKLLPDIQLRKLRLRFLRDQQVWIFWPLAVSIETSPDGRSWQEAYRKDLAAKACRHGPKPYVLILDAKLHTDDSFRYLRIHAANIGSCPSWHPGAGGKAWIFTDEIVYSS
jgi:hypothetical protein